MTKKPHRPARKKLWDPWEADAWAPPPLIQLDEWAEANLVLPKSVGAASGPLSWDLVPFAREILRAGNDPAVEMITLCFSAQTAKTTICQAILLYYMAEGLGPCMHVTAREEDARDACKDRFLPLIEASPNLAKFLTGAAHDATRGAIRLNETSLFFRGSNSPAGLATWPVRVVNFDEVDKYKPFSGKEADPIALGTERTTTFHDRKILKSSTPTTRLGYIWASFEEGDQRRFRVPCPRCGHFQELVFGRVKIPEGERDREKIIERQLAWYECIACGEKIRDAEKPWMLRRGVWCPKGMDVGKDGQLVGEQPSRRHLSFHMSRLYAPWPNTTWSHVMAEFLRCKDRRNELMNFRNSWLAEPWEATVDEMKDSHIRARVKPYKQGQPPARGILATAGVDVQARELWYVVRVWGHSCESWLYRCGAVTDFDSLRAILDAPIMFGARRIHLRQVLVDCGYSDRMDEVFRWCQETGATPGRGASAPKLPIHVKQYDSTLGPIALAWLDTGYFKDLVHRGIRASDGVAHAWHLPVDTPEEYFGHLVAEQKVPATNKATGRVSLRWTSIPAGAANHMFDCEVYARAGAELAGVEFLQPLPASATEQPPEPPPEQPPDQLPGEPPQTPPPPPPPPKRGPGRLPRVTRIGVRHFRR